MKYKKIIIDKKEYERLNSIIAAAPNNNDPSYAVAIGKLIRELKTADIRGCEEIPMDVVRLHSIVSIKTPFCQNTTFELVHPEKSDISKNKLSILAPMGLALIGYANGDKIKWQFPSGIHTIEILAVNQPEVAIKTNLV
jgi:regulator of nucleoside diphosphate kinase